MNLIDYFSFTRGEKRGIVVLMFIIFLLALANLSVDFLESKSKTDFSEFEKEIAEFEKEIESQKNNSTKNNFQPSLFKFNPNTISEEEWKKLGFKEWQIKTIFNYKAKGGSWRTKKDVAKIYGLEESHFNQLKPFILLPDKIENNNKYSLKEKSIKPQYFNFNPNTISKEEWAKLGFKDWQIKTIFNYKAKGGSWRTKKDVQKIYGLSESAYTQLAPYILLPDSIAKKENQKKKKDYTIKVDINTANAKELTQLKGIFSEKYAAIIIKHRDQLGGFTSKEQLKDVWNMTEETYNGLLPQVIIGKYEPKQININTSSAQQLQQHPYIDWKIANAIIKYRNAHGKYKKVEDIKKIHLINNKTYLKIAPYLIVK
ncbi:MAG: helix-hairpin-helix domain-containing protein [Vicingaceae bacterium]